MEHQLHTREGALSYLPGSHPPFLYTILPGREVPGLKSGNEGAGCLQEAPRSPIYYPGERGGNQLRSEHHLPISAQGVMAGRLALWYPLNVRVTCSANNPVGANSNPQPQPPKALETMHLRVGPGQPLFSEKCIAT